MAEETGATLEGLFKRRYGKLVRAVPEFSILAQQIPFREKDRIGEEFQHTIRLRRAMGWTAAGGAAAVTAFALNAAVPGQNKPARVAGQAFVLREAVAYVAILRALKKGDAAFMSTLDEIVLDMYESAAFARELCLLYGGTDIGIVNDNGPLAATHTFPLTLASTAAGLWSQMEGGKVDVWDTALAVKRNATTDITVDAVELKADNTIEVTLTGLAAEIDAIIIGDKIVPKGFNGQWMDGLDRIATNTGVLFGIDAAAFRLWQANTLDVSGVPGLGVLNTAAAKSVTRAGLRPLVLLISPFVWGRLNTDAASLRREPDGDKSSKSIKLGTRSLTYYGPNGTIEIKPHPMVKNGDGFLYDPELFDRIGSTDLTFRLPGIGPDKFFKNLDDAAGGELRCMWDQAIICRRPAHIVKLLNLQF